MKALLNFLKKEFEDNKEEHIINNHVASKLQVRNDKTRIEEKMLVIVRIYSN
jgi:hypothetical protein